jgi:hypothetical protein
MRRVLLIWLWGAEMEHNATEGFDFSNRTREEGNLAKQYISGYDIVVSRTFFSTFQQTADGQ